MSAEKKECEMNLKALSTLAVACFLFAGFAPAETVQFEENWGDPGFTVVSQSPTGLEILYTVPSVTFDTIEVDGETMTTVGIPGVILPNNAGAPDLPGVGRFIAFPQHAAYKVEVLARKSVSYKMKVAPAAEIQAESDDSPPVYEKDPAIYGLDAVYPPEPVLSSSPTTMRGVDVFILGITPFAYNPVREELEVFTNIRIKVTFEGGNGQFGDVSYRSRWLEPMMKQHLVNYASLPAVDFDARKKNAGREDECDYMIFSPNDSTFLSWADTIKDFRVKQGISTNVYNIADLGGTSTGIENKINSAYNTWSNKPVAVLMLGDTSNMPTKKYSGYTLSDNMYADVNGDNLPEVNIARMTARNSTDLSLLINKFIDYETSPPTDTSFYNNPIVAGGWQTERWFILCTEVVFGFLTNEEGKSPEREYAIYSGYPGSQWSTATNTSTVVNYFGPNGLGYIPSTPGHLSDWGGNATRINNDINSGAFYMLHRDHGYEQGWGEPDYDTGDLSGLNNDDLCFVMSINCSTGKYDASPECFAEAFHRMTYGALGVIAASGTSYSFVNDTFVWGMHDSMWPHFDPGYSGSTGDNQLMPSFANMSGKWYLQASSWPYNTSSKTITYHLFHMHGDAFTQLYTEMPQSLSVSHGSSIDASATSFAVTADAGSLIAISKDGVVLGTATGTGGSVNVSIDPPGSSGTMYVTVTELNHYRYEGTVTVTGGGSTLTVDVTLSSTSYQRGEWCFYDVDITNHTASSLSTTMWTNVTLPNSNTWPNTGYLNGPLNITVPGNDTQTWNYSRRIPNVAPIGSFVMNAYIGSNPGIDDEDHENFSITY